MKYEVQEQAGRWIVRCDGREVGSFDSQDLALDHVRAALRAEKPGEASLAVRFERRRA